MTDALNYGYFTDDYEEFPKSIVSLNALDGIVLGEEFKNLITTEVYKLLPHSTLGTISVT